MDKYKVVIIGAGPAGVTAAIYALRSGCTVAIIEKMMVGGQVASCTDIRNYPGIDHLDGLKWSSDTKRQVEQLGGVFIYDEAVDVDTDNNILHLASKKQLEYGALVLAMGAKPRKLGAPGEDKFAGRGVSYCATCDGALYKGQVVAVVGGGNTAFEDAKYLANLCSEVHMFIRKSAPRAESALQVAVSNLSNIHIHYLSNIASINGDDRVQNIDYDTDGTMHNLPVSAVFMAIGRGPDTEAFSSAVECDNAGYIVTDSNMYTSHEGIFACGDVRVTPLRQIVTATSDGALAGLNAAKYVKLKNKG